MILKEKILFSETECKNIIKIVSANPIVYNEKDRKYQAKSIKYEESTKWIFDKLINYLELQTNITVIKINEIIHFHIFKNLDWFDKHNDEKNRRLFAIGVLLNDDFEGGDFIFYDDNKNCKLEKKIGNTYIFDVKLTHEITKITKGERYSLLWFLHDFNIKRKNNSFI